MGWIWLSYKLCERIKRKIALKSLELFLCQFLKIIFIYSSKHTIFIDMIFSKKKKKKKKKKKFTSCLKSY